MYLLWISRSSWPGFSAVYWLWISGCGFLYLHGLDSVLCFSCVFQDVDFAIFMAWVQCCVFVVHFRRWISQYSWPVFSAVYWLCISGCGFLDLRGLDSVLCFGCVFQDVDFSIFVAWVQCCVLVVYFRGQYCVLVVYFRMLISRSSQPGFSAVYWLCISGCGFLKLHGLGSVLCICCAFQEMDFSIFMACFQCCVLVVDFRTWISRSLWPGFSAMFWLCISGCGFLYLRGLGSVLCIGCVFQGSVLCIGCVFQDVDFLIFAAWVQCCVLVVYFRMWISQTSWPGFSAVYLLCISGDGFLNIHGLGSVLCIGCGFQDVDFSIIMAWVQYCVLVVYFRMWISLSSWPGFSAVYWLCISGCGFLKLHGLGSVLCICCAFQEMDFSIFMAWVQCCVLVVDFRTWISQSSWPGFSTVYWLCISGCRFLDLRGLGSVLCIGCVFQDVDFSIFVAWVQCYVLVVYFRMWISRSSQPGFSAVYWLCISGCGFLKLHGLGSVLCICCALQEMDFSIFMAWVQCCVLVVDFRTWISQSSWPGFSTVYWLWISGCRFLDLRGLGSVLCIGCVFQNVDFSIFVAWVQCCVTVVFITVSRTVKQLMRPAGHEAWGHTVKTSFVKQDLAVKTTKPSSVCKSFLWS